jgi:hypothetical protein
MQDKEVRSRTSTCAVQLINQLPAPEQWVDMERHRVQICAALSWALALKPNQVSREEAGEALLQVSPPLGTLSA